MRSALAVGVKAAISINTPAKTKSELNWKPRGGNLDFRMYSPKARRIGSLVTIAAAMARLFWGFRGEIQPEIGAGCTGRWLR